MRDRSGTALEICTATLNSLPSGLGSVQATPHFVPISETPRASPQLITLPRRFAYREVFPRSFAVSCIMDGLRPVSTLIVSDDRR